jgi:hypothetical protein
VPTNLTVDKAGRIVLPKPLREKLQSRPVLRMENEGESITLRPILPKATLAEEFGIGVFQCGPSDDPIPDLVDRVGEQRLREFFQPGDALHPILAMRDFLDTSVLVAALEIRTFITTPAFVSWGTTFQALRVRVAYLGRAACLDGGVPGSSGSPAEASHAFRGKSLEVASLSVRWAKKIRRDHPSLASPAGGAYDAWLLRCGGQMRAQNIYIWNRKPFRGHRARSRQPYSYAVKGSAIAYLNSAIAASNASLGGRTRSCGSVANGSSVMFSMSRNVGLSELT